MHWKLFTLLAAGTTVLAPALMLAQHGPDADAPHGALSPVTAPSAPFASAPRIAWAPADSADSLYRAARAALSDGKDKRAAELFRSIRDRFPKSQYVAESLYWEAFALSRTGESADLRSALAALKLQREKYPKVAAAGDAAALDVRIRGELARRGDAGAAAGVLSIVSEQLSEAAESAREAEEAVRESERDARESEQAAREVERESRTGEQEVRETERETREAERSARASGRSGSSGIVGKAGKAGKASKADKRELGDKSEKMTSRDRRSRGDNADGDNCGSEDDDMRIVALNALMQMDADAAMPILRDVLAKRGACTERLRRKAVFLVSQKNSPESADLLFQTVRTDPSPDVQREAVFWLSQVHGDRAVTFLDSLLRISDDEEIRDKAIFALSQHNSPRAVELLRAMVERPGTSMETKRRAIFALGHFRGHADDGEFLRRVYPKLGDDDLREAAIQSVAQISSDPGAGPFLLGIARDPKAPYELRKKALFWASQSHGLALAEIAKLYDETADSDMKEQAIFALSQRNETAAVDKLLDIARRDPNVDLRRKAIFWLGEKRDPRVRQLLLEIINK